MPTDKLNTQEVINYISSTFGNFYDIYQRIVASRTAKDAYRFGKRCRYAVKECFPWIDLRQVSAARCGEVARQMWEEVNA